MNINILASLPDSTIFDRDPETLTPEMRDEWKLRIRRAVTKFRAIRPVRSDSPSITDFSSESTVTPDVPKKRGRKRKKDVEGTGGEASAATPTPT